MFEVPKVAQASAERFMAEVFPVMAAAKSAEVKAAAHKHVFPVVGGGYCAFCGAKKES